MADIDKIVQKLWEIEYEFDDDADGVASDMQVYGWHDQWWGITATCEHGRFSGVSNGIGDPSQGFERLLKAFEAGHKKETT